MATYRPFRFGAGEIGFQSRAEWVAYARKVEALGYATLWLGEHPSQGGPELSLALLAAADATTTLRITSQVFANDVHHPVQLAQIGATLDLLSEGRLEFGIGAGWLALDYNACSIPFDPPAVRIGRLEEAVHVIKGLWGTEPVTFAGQYYQVPELNPQPKPIQRPHPPIFIGGGGQRMLRLAAREADIVGLDAQGTAAGTKNLDTTSADVVAKQVHWIREEAGERFGEIELHTIIWAVQVTDDQRHGADQIAAMLARLPSTMITNPPTAAHILASPQFLVGTVDQIVADLQAYRERYGISYFSVFGDDVDVFSPIVARLAGT